MLSTIWIRLKAIALLTCLVGDLEGELLEISSIYIAGGTGKLQIGRHAAVSRLNIGSRVARTFGQAAISGSVLLDHDGCRGEPGEQESLPEPHDFHRGMGIWKEDDEPGHQSCRGDGMEHIYIIR